MKKEKKIKVRNEEGEIVKKEFDCIEKQKIIHFCLGDDLLQRIKNVYYSISEVINDVYEYCSTLEQFEILFMRDQDPENDIKIWEDMAETFIICQKYFGSCPEVKKNIFRIIISNLLGLLDEEQKEREDIKFVCQIFDDVSGER